MKKIYISIITALLVSAGANINAQTTIYTQNFDSLASNLPTGWITTGWAMDSATANRSTGFIGASGLFNCKVSNGTALTATYFLTSIPISTIGY
jgi:hypothetical protein